MRISLFRTVRWTTLILPFIWFFYSMSVVFKREDNSSLSLRDAIVQAPGILASESNAFTYAKARESHNIHITEVKDVDENNVNRYAEESQHEAPKNGNHELNVLRKPPNLPFSRSVRHRKRDYINNRRAAKHDVIRMGGGAKEAEDGSEDGQKERGDGFSALQVVVDDYEDVTYPLFVENLPSNARGQGIHGLKIEENDLPESQRSEFRDKWNKNSFNQWVSDLIPVHRELPDVRPQVCREKKYPDNLPTISVVIIFHNEAWSVLLRSVHSILDRTNPDLLIEVILVDDFSEMEHLKRPLDKYFSTYPKVKIVRSPERGGLTRARIRGFTVSMGEVIVFLDSHIECTDGWAEPMLEVIANDYRSVPFPVIDLINANTLQYVPISSSPIGTFSIQTLTFTWSQTPDRIQNLMKAQTDPKLSPTMPGGLFAISRRWFIELGMYDPDLDFWGGENMELSFKAWMCNGSVVITECSHIGHIFRSQNPIKWASNIGYRNYVRVAMVWMDEYRYHFFERINNALGDYGDISERIALRKNLNCHTFSWYVDNIYPELKDQLVLNTTYAGKIVHDSSGQCLDSMSKTEKGPQLFSCHSMGGNQFWFLSEDKYLQTIDSRFVIKSTDVQRPKGVLLSPTKREEWRYNEISKQLRHVETDLCLQKEAVSVQLLILERCSSSALQKWTLNRRKMFEPA